MKVEKGIFTDFISEKEILFSRKVAKRLKKACWTHAMFMDAKIVRALSMIPNPNRSYSEVNEIKSALFEIRFANAIDQLGYSAEYECSMSVKNSTIDFKINSLPLWLVELTSIRESEAVKKNTTEKNGIFEFISSNNKCDNPLIKDILKTQSVLCSKVFEKQKAQEVGDPIKFPEVGKNIYHLLVIDMRSFCAGISDCFDYHNICYGNKFLTPKGERRYSKFLTDISGNKEPLKGLFDEEHPDPRSKYIRERIHAIGFIAEEKYTNKEIINNIKIFPNPNFFESFDSFQSISLFKPFCKFKKYE